MRNLLFRHLFAAKLWLMTFMGSKGGTRAALALGLAMAGPVFAQAHGFDALYPFAHPLEAAPPPPWLGEVAVWDARTKLARHLPTQPYALRLRPGGRPKRADKAGRKLSVPQADGLLDWRDGRVSLAVAAPKGGASDLTEGARLKLDLPALSMDAALSAQVGKDEDQAALWHKRGAKLDMDLHLLPKTALRLTGARDYALRYREPSGIGAGLGKPRVLDTDDSSAKIAATLSPLAGVTLTLGAAGSGRLTRDATYGRDSELVSAVETYNREVFAIVHWQPLDWLGLEASGREKTAAIAWRASHAKSGEARGFEPRVAIRIGFAGAQWQASLERASQAFDAGEFVAYASLATKSETVPVKPDSAWTYRAEVERQLGPVAIRASYTAARAGSVTEYGFSATKAQAPVSTRLIARDSVDVALSLPLEGVGLGDTMMEGRAVWQDSLVRDPLTSADRRASNEVPASLTLKLERKLPAEKIKLGVEGVLSDQRTSYQTRQITASSSGGRLGAYLAYAPGAYEIRLDVDRLIDTPQTVDYLYKGSRTVPQEPVTAMRSDTGPTVRFSLRRRL